MKRDFLLMLPREALERLRNDPVIFAQVVLNFQPWPFQAKILRDKSKRLIMVCGRQVGKSTISAVKAIHFAATNPNTTTIIISASLRQSMETYDKIQGFLGATVLRTSVKKRTLTQTHLTNGSRIICLPSGRTGHTLHGMTVHFAIIDEAARVPEVVISEAIFPMLLATNGIVWMPTTPLDKDHITYRAFMNSKDVGGSWSVYHFPSTISPLVTPEFCEQYRQDNGEDAYRRQILAEFVDDADSYFPMSLLRSCIGEPLQTMEQLVVNAPDRLYFDGLDPGGKLSFAANVIGERVGAKTKLRWYSITKQLSDSDTIYTRQVIEASDIHLKLRFRKVVIDQTGLGGPIVEHAKRLNMPVEGVGIHVRTAEELFSDLRLAMENQAAGRPNGIEIPDDVTLINHLNAIHYKRSKARALLFEKSEGSYDDLGYGTALMFHGAKNYATLARIDHRKEKPKR